MTFRAALRQCRLGTTLSEEQISHLGRHYDLLTKWNRRLNLTAISSVTDVVKVHFFESLMLPSILPEGRLEIADVGSGAGFPGMPLAVVRTDCQVSLIESHRRKAVFLREVARGLPNVTVFAGRAEDLTRKFDWVVARAVRPDMLLTMNIAPNFAIFTSLPELTSLCAPAQIIPIPGTRDRVIALFHVERDKIDSGG